MSKQALYHYAENLQLVQKATFTDHTGKVRGLGENGRDLLVFLCNAANEKRNFCFHMGHQYIAEETGIHIATVKRLMNGFEQLGWITRTGEVIRHQGRGAPTVEYCLTFYAPLTQNERTGSQTSSHMATDNLGKAKPGKDTSQKLQTETEPKPEPQPQPQPQVVSDQVSGQGKAGEWGNVHAQLLAECLSWERSHFTGIDKGGLAKKWATDYRPLVATAIATKPQADLVAWCVRERALQAGLPVPYVTTSRVPQVPEGDPNCEHGCEGKKYHMVINPDTDGWTTTRCVCDGGDYSTTHEATQERVSSDQGDYIDTHAPQASADPQSDPVKQLTKRLRHIA